MPVAETEKRRTTKPITSKVDVWLGRETPRVRQALESASRHFDGDDSLTVNTLKDRYSCTIGHWRTIDGRPVFICG